MPDHSPPPVSPDDASIGWIGLGVMGQSMCGHVLAAGYRVTVFTRARSKAESLLERGADWADSPADVARASDLVFSIVGFPQDVREISLGPSGVLAAGKAGDIYVDMTTSEPTLAEEIAAAAQEKGIAAIDAPVSGGDVGAREARLSIMLGGDATACERITPLLKLMGKTIVRQGGPGAGQHCKMVNQTLIASGMVGVCEALLYGHRAGLDLTTALKSVASGAAGSWSLSNLGPRMIAGDFAPGFFVEHFVKDLGIALAEAKRMNLCLPGLALAEQLYRAVLAHGRGKLGTQALLLSLAELSGVEWRKS